MFSDAGHKLFLTTIPKTLPAADRRRKLAASNVSGASEASGARSSFGNSRQAATKNARQANKNTKNVHENATNSNNTATITQEVKTNRRPGSA